MTALLIVLIVAQHEVTELRCPEQVNHRVARDLDGDGIDDLMVISGKEAWIWHGRRRGFPAGPDRRIRFEDGAAMFDVHGGELIVRYPERYRALYPKPRTLPYASGPGLPPKAANILWRGFFRDLDQDKKLDFVDVSLDGYTITFGGGDKVTLPPHLMEKAGTDVDAISERLIARYALGDWTGGNFNGDLRPDFAVMTETGLLVYTGDARGRFDPARRIEIEIDEARDADLTFIDFNLDGKTDVLAVRRKQGKISVLIADPAKGLAAPPHRIRLALPGKMRYPVVTDLDGDKRPDLALPYIPKFTFEDAVRVLTRGEVLVKVPLFVNRGGKNCIPARADAQLTIPIRVRARVDEAGRIKLSGLVIVEYEGDLDGDGRRDLLVTETPEVLAVRRGVPVTVFHEEVLARISVPDCSAFDSVKSVAANLNGDKLSDIILHYRGAGGRADRLFVLLSRKK